VAADLKNWLVKPMVGGWEIRVFHDGRFIRWAVCQELAGETAPLREVIRRGNAAAPRSAGQSRT
jgi:hypothetical protein